MFGAFYFGQGYFAGAQTEEKTVVITQAGFVSPRMAIIEAGLFPAENLYPSVELYPEKPGFTIV